MSEAKRATGRMLEIAGLAAQMILENGAETYRVEDTVIRLCRSYGYNSADVLALSTGVLISVSDAEEGASTIRRVRKRSMNLARVNAVNALSREIAAQGMGMDEALARLRAIAEQPDLPAWQTALAAGLAAGSFALMFGGGWIPCLVAFVCGAIVQAASTVTGRADISLVLVSLVGGLLCSAITMLASFVFPMTPAMVETALAGAIMPLISGLMMTNAVRDTLRGDLLSGMAQGMEALLVAIMVALGISLLLRIYLPPQSDVVLAQLPWLLAVLYAGIATMFFCPLLRIPGRAVLPASLLGALAYGAYLYLVYLGVGDIMALFLASAAIAMLCDLLARRMRMVVTVFMSAALIPLVPGLGLYRTMRALLPGQSADAVDIGLQTLFSIGAIALGAAIGSLRLHKPEKIKKAPKRRSGKI